jgi:hypothetical protein
VLPLLTLDELETAELALTDREFRQAQRRWGTALTPAWARRWKVEPHDGRPPEADGPERRS